MFQNGAAPFQNGCPILGFQNGAAPFENGADSKMGHNNYIMQIPRTPQSMLFSMITESKVKKIIEQLPEKTSSGHDMVSNVLFKILCPVLLYPLCIVFNQSLASGIFPSNMKIAEIIPLYKGKDED